MRFSSALAIFTLFWAMSYFFVLPFRLKSGDGPDAFVPGQAESAPPRFSFRRTAFWTTVVAIILFGLYYANYVYGWIGVGSLDFFSAPDRKV